MHTSRAFGVLVAIAFSIVGIAAQRSSDPIAIDADDLAGIVSGPKGPEAGAWVIAETTDLPTRFARMVVTDERYVAFFFSLTLVRYVLLVRDDDP